MFGSDAFRVAASVVVSRFVIVSISTSETNLET